MTFSIRAERPEDISAISSALANAFAAEPVVVELVHALRALSGGLPTVSLVAESGQGDIVGHVMLTSNWVDAPDRLVDVYVLSPLGVRADWQNRGIGRALIAAAVAAAEEGGAPLVFLEGDPRYYSKHGFKAAGPLGFVRPSPRIPDPAFQVQKLRSYTDDMTGPLVYRDAFWRLDCVGLR